MVDYLKDKYGNGILTIANLKKAVVKTWITSTDFKTITGQDYVV